MSAPNPTPKIENFRAALARLGEAVQRPPASALEIDGALGRFEFTIELAWKTLRAVMVARGLSEPKSPRECFRAAFAAGLIADEAVFLDMLDDRNRTSHVYDEAVAADIFYRLSGYWRALGELAARLAETTG